MNGRMILSWIRANVFIVIFGVVMIAALVALPMLSGKMNKGIQADVQERVSQRKKLETLEKTRVTIEGTNGPIVDQSALVNQATIDAFRVRSESELEDAGRIVERAIQHNQKDRSVLMPELFPAPSAASRDVLPRRFHDALVQEYDRLLEDVRAGTPPEASVLEAQLIRNRQAFLVTRLQKDDGADLTPEETAQLNTALASARVNACAEAADRFSFYCAPEVLGVPAFDGGVDYSARLDELFMWQWDLWVAQDILEAVAESDRSVESVRESPVKRIVFMEIGEPGVLSSGAVTTTASGGSGGGGGGGLGMSTGGGGRGGGGETSAAPAVNNAIAPNPKLEVKRDYSLSPTGRGSNPIYDVREVQLSLIVETARLPEVFNAIAKRNFMTVVDAQVRPADPYEALSGGYFYGRAPVSEVDLVIETIWFREWIREKMPDELAARLGIWKPSAQPTPPADPSVG